MVRISSVSEYPTMSLNTITYPPIKFTLYFIKSSPYVHSTVISENKICMYNVIHVVFFSFSKNCYLSFFVHLQSQQCKTKEDLKNVNCLQTDSRAMKKMWSEKFSWAFSSGKLKAETMTFLVLVQFLYKK